MRSRSSPLRLGPQPSEIGDLLLSTPSARSAASTLPAIVTQCSCGAMQCSKLLNLCNLFCLDPATGARKFSAILQTWITHGRQLLRRHIKKFVALTPRPAHESFLPFHKLGSHMDTSFCVVSSNPPRHATPNPTGSRPNQKTPLPALGFFRPPF